MSGTVDAWSWERPSGWTSRQWFDSWLAYNGRDDWLRPGEGPFDLFITFQEQLVAAVEREMPGLPQWELWIRVNDRLYGAEVPRDVLDRMFAKMRSDGEAGAPPYDK